MVPACGSGRVPGGRPSAPCASPLTRVLSPLVEAEWSDMLEGLAPFFRERRYSAGQVIFRKGAAASSIYFITHGEVTLWEPEDGREALKTQLKAGTGALRPVRSSASVDLGGGLYGTRLVRYVSGGIFGELDFFLRHARSFTAVASTDDCTIQVLTREALQSMQSQASGLAAALEHALLKYLSFQVNAKLGLSDGVKDARTTI